MDIPPKLPGAGRCPACDSTKTRRLHISEPAFTRFYAADIEACRTCGTLWEPYDAAQLLDADDPRTSSFREPCGNCAFRSGSFEQSDPERWRELIAQLKGDTGDPYSMLSGSGFYCHKGVPLDPGSKNGFAYPVREASLPGGVVTYQDRDKLRPCRGWLRMIRTALDRQPEQKD